MLDKQPHRHREGVLLAPDAFPSRISLPSIPIDCRFHAIAFLDENTSYLTASLMQHLFPWTRRGGMMWQHSMLDGDDEERPVRP